MQAHNTSPRLDPLDLPRLVNFNLFALSTSNLPFDEEAFTCTQWYPSSPPLYKDIRRPSQHILSLISNTQSLRHLSPWFTSPPELGHYTATFSLNKSALSSHLLHLRWSPVIEVSAIFPEGCVKPSLLTFTHI